MKREYRVTLCPQCAEECGIWIESAYTDWYCSDKRLAEAITEEAESEENEDGE